MKAADTFVLSAADGKTISVQTWPLAYWPDGSLKWTGHAIEAQPGATGPFQLSVGDDAPSGPRLTCRQDADSIDIDTSAMQCHILKRASTLFDSLMIGNRKVAQDAKLVALTEDRSEQDAQGVIRSREFVSQIKSVTVEQTGPLRAVVKIEGMHQESARMLGAFGAATFDPGVRMPGQEWLPFVVRLYFYAGDRSIHIVSLVHFLTEMPGRISSRALAYRFRCPFRKSCRTAMCDFAGDPGGIWVQPVRLIPGYRGALSSTDYAAHLAGKRMPPLASMNANGRAAILSVPVWNDFKLTQLGPDSFSIDKRTGAQGSWFACGTTGIARRGSRS